MEKMIYGLEDKPKMAERIVLGLQHIFAAFGGIIVVPIMISSALGFDAAMSTALISASIFAAGVATIVQSRGVGPVGSRLPSIMGTDITYAAPAIAVGARFGMGGILGAIIAGGFIQALSSIFTKQIVRFFPKVVIGIVISLIGLTLIANSVNWLGGGAAHPEFGNINGVYLGLFVLIFTLLLNYYGKGFLKTASILIGMTVGYLIAIPMGMVDFTPVAEAPIFAIPNGFTNGITFNIEAILAFLPAFLVGTISIIGRVKAIEGVVGLEEDTQRVRGAILADGAVTLFGGLVGGLSSTVFAQNIGLLSITKVTSRHVTIMAGIILALLGLLPKFGAIIHAMPQQVLGGAGVMMFGMIAVAGINILKTVEFNNRNMLIIAISIASGLGVAFRGDILSQFPSWVTMIFSSGITTGTIIAIVLNLILREEKQQEKK